MMPAARCQRLAASSATRLTGVSSAQMAQAPAQTLRACSLGHAHLASPLAQNASKGPPSAKCDHLVLVARITAVKGQHVAVRVAQRLGCELVLAGPVGPYQTSDELAADPHADRYPHVRYYREKVARILTATRFGGSAM